MRLPQWLLERRNAEVVPDTALTHLTTLVRSLLRRDGSSDSGSDSGSSGSVACDTTGSQSACQTSNNTAGNEETALIVCVVVIPLCCAFFALIYLHRRHTKKTRIEDVKDAEAPLDYGLEGVVRKNKKGVPEMTVTDLGGASGPRADRGRSLEDMALHSPYLLPAGLNGSRESVRSMTRSFQDDDPYRPVTMLRPSLDSESLRYPPRRGNGNGSMYSESIGYQSTVEKESLVANARPMSQSFPKLGGSSSSPDSEMTHDYPVPSLPTVDQDFLPDRPLTLVHDKELEPSLPNLPDHHDAELPPIPSNLALPPRGDSMAAREVLDARQSSNYGDDETSTHLAAVAIHEPEDEQYDIDPSLIVTGRASLDEPSHAADVGVGLGLQAPGLLNNNRLSVVGVRPLPPDVPDDNPEQRANRIRSFYREYFDDSKPNPSGGYYDQGPEGLEATIYDPETGGFYIPGSRPFAQGPGRRAMTPPPRGKPRVSGNSGPHGRKHSMMSTGRVGPRGRAAAPQKKLPPPKALNGLPTPYLLKKDDAIFNAIDFAPPSSFRTVQNGAQADTPSGLPRPFSPSVRAFSPLVSSFDHLSVMPSPHELRKSSTFTALDFAPPSRLRDPASGGTETGSIRSNRSGISAMTNDAVRHGAYRVSRIPKEMVTTKEDITSQLRPRMNLISPA